MSFLSCSSPTEPAGDLGSANTIRIKVVCVHPQAGAQPVVTTQRRSRRRLQAEGLMHPAGLAAVALAKDDGRWDAAYAGQATIEVPADLTAALDREPLAKAMFDRLSSQNRYAVLYRIHEAKRSDTRARRIERFVAMLARGETIHPQSKANRSTDA
jgi:uncharacterized protein YdeI (YjbR/CyaY-like superfamily)